MLANAKLQEPPYLKIYMKCKPLYASAVDFKVEAYETVYLSTVLYLH